MLAGERFRAKPLEVRNQLLALGQKTALGKQAGADAALDALDERSVLPADLLVEGDQLVHPVLLDVGREEVVEEAPCALGAEREDWTAGQIRVTGKDVEPEVRPEEVELAPRHLTAREE